MLRVAFKHTYFGWNFHGNQYQPHLRTVDGEIFRALRKMGVDPENGNYRVAGRTDAGVSALGNVFAINLESFEPWIVNAINANLPEDITVWGYAVVDENFNPRKARSRVYRYVMLDEGFDLDAMREAAELLKGKHDFSGFAKGCRPCIREIFTSEIEIHGDFLVYTIEGNAFAWNMVRKIVTALKIAGKEGNSEIVERILKGDRIPLTPASPFGLILMDVKYTFEFEEEERALSLLNRRIEENMTRFAQLYGIFRFLR